MPDNASQINKPNGMSSLEQRVAAAIGDGGGALTAAQLGALWTELEAAIPVTAAAADEARAAAEDPLQTSDLQAAQNDIETTALASARLKALAPRLQQKYAAVYETERF